MLPPSDYTAFKDYQLNRLPPLLAEGRQQRLLREAGVVVRPWLSCQVCRSLLALARMLVATGQWLQRHSGPAALAPR